MGWSSQGYNSKSGCWEVYGYETGLNPEIEKFHNKKVELTEYRKTRISFGPTGEQFFKGYVFSDNEEIVKSILENFNGFLVYASKYGDKPHEFEVKNLTFYNFEEITLFLERTIFYDFEWDGFKKHLEWSLDFDNVSERTKNKVLGMTVPIDYIEERERIEKLISQIEREDDSLITEIIESVNREDLQRELKEEFK